MDSKFLAPILILVVLNIAAFVLMDMDKRRARGSGWRIPEQMLLMLAAIGGTIGTYLGCIIFRHKIHKRGFTTTLHLILTLQVLAALWLWSRT
jgi:uncharacterized membrane protein YsdA (DUF1294 family)